MPTHPKPEIVVRVIDFPDFLRNLENNFYSPHQWAIVLRSEGLYVIREDGQSSMQPIPDGQYFDFDLVEKDRPQKGYEGIALPPKAVLTIRVAHRTLAGAPNRAVKELHEFLAPRPNLEFDRVYASWRKAILRQSTIH